MAKANDTRVHVCQHCGAEFTGRKKKFCSAKCRTAHANGHNPKGHQCTNCGEVFHGRKKKYCSEACFKEAKGERDRLAKAIKRDQSDVARRYHRMPGKVDYPRGVESDAEKRRWRYSNDPEYRSRELGRHYVYRARRRLNKRLSNDGTVTATVISERDRCLYCDTPLTRENRTLDHMVPINLGGEHSAANVTGCCLTCNTSKQATPFEDWLDRLSEPHRTRALREYMRKRGSHPKQVRLMLVFTQS